MTRALIVGQAAAQAGYLGSDRFGIIALILAFLGGVVLTAAVVLLVRTFEEGAFLRGLTVRR